MSEPFAFGRDDATDGRPSRVPSATRSFWVLTVLTMGFGETASDFLVGVAPAPGLVLITVAVAGAMLALRIRGPRVAWVYWAATLAVSVAGATGAGVLRRSLGLSDSLLSAELAVVLGVVLLIWRRSEGTVAAGQVSTVRRELYFWGAGLATVALGTVVADWTAVALQLGYVDSGIAFAALLLLPVITRRALGLDPVVAFWCAYVLARPLGASLSDWIALPTGRGGLGSGDGPVALIELVVVGLLVARLRRCGIGGVVATR
ncbi:hypothetical protein [Amnibacterium sp.]|uniref:hypothetical protein n=1 Tax=Amnibacterium sp. TaxID=1872496 RepID=UPI0026048BE1|nr:hypothetical protein [Amnibacterium sp.]MCU1473268.1 hypothetical protein [Amnibacterium sp.]